MELSICHPKERTYPCVGKALGLTGYIMIGDNSRDSGNKFLKMCYIRIECACFRS